MKYKVNDMSCKHCVMRIEKTLAEANIKGTVDLATKTVVSDSEEVPAVLSRIGYKAVK